MIIDGIDLDRPELWEAYALGYQWGITYGITMGRQELAAELMPVGTVIAELKLWRDVAYAELQRRRATYTRPALSPDEAHAQAVASWSRNPSSTSSRPAPILP